jgi:hypothetical protein
MSDKAKKQKLVTPIGEAMWAHVHQPKPPFVDERGQTKGEPKYQLDVVFDPKEPAWAQFANSIREQLKALPQQPDKRTGEAMPKQSPIKRELDNEDKPTGRLVATFKTGTTFKPGVFDRYGQPIPETTLVGNGSKVKVSYTPNTYEGFGGGINFYLNAVQVMELVEYQKQSASAYGFETEALPEGSPESDTNGGDSSVGF